MLITTHNVPCIMLHGHNSHDQFSSLSPAPRPKINYPRHGFRAECSQVTPEYITYWHTRGNHDQTDKMTPPAHSGECVKLGEFLAIQTLKVKIRK